MTVNRFQIHVGPPNGTPRPAEVTVTGEVDAATADQFLRAVHELPGPRPLIVNLSPAFYFDSAGFAGWHKPARTMDSASRSRYSNASSGKATGSSSSIGYSKKLLWRKTAFDSISWTKPQERKPNIMV